jgi:carboxyl-terminal processing protease
MKKNKPAKEDLNEEMPKPIEFASKDDYQMNQALNLLKAWQIMQKK